MLGFAKKSLIQNHILNKQLNKSFPKDIILLRDFIESRV